LTPFSYHRPLELSDAMVLLGESERQTRIIAGGQSLLLWMKDRIVRPERLISIADLPGIKGTKQTDDGGLEIGAATTYAALAQTSFHGWQREIAAVAGNLADRSVRSLGTIGGALCDANPRYDMPTLVVASDAMLTVAGAGGSRQIPAADFFKTTGGTSLRSSDLLLSITMPPPERFDAMAFEKFRHRVFEAAVVTVCCGVKLDDEGRIVDLRLVAGALAKAPSVASSVTRELKGTKPKGIDVKSIARAAADELMPANERDSRHKSFQAELVISLAARALTRVFTATGRR